ncbi:MAG: 23S rRNA (pseudouridine(1915)-N(3))-methyltransferase RlmH [Alphaproteobacteria bacterium]|nr:23S rRNA (pseudouridine(1915)-N(3))-methyltransferase RlmH [Alphaproteobacteria bacterium]
MRLVIAAVGRARGDPSAALTAAWLERLPWPATLVEIEERGRFAPAARKAAEAKKLLAAIPAGATLVALDPAGRTLSSEAFAAQLGRWRDQGLRELAFVIGGAEGLDQALLARAALRLSFGPMVFAHLLARAMLAEQLYRASTILAGHPYHRG